MADEATKNWQAPTRFALKLTIGYTVIALAYILISTPIASSLVEDLEALARIEKAKGIAFIVATAIGLFFLTRYLMQKLEDQVEASLAKERRVEAEENRTIAKSMIGSIAHDSNNMLSTILFGSELLRAQGTLADKQLVTLGRIKSAGEQIRELNNRLIEASHFDDQLPVETFDVKDAMREVVHLAKASSRIHQANCSIALIGDSVPIRANRHLLIQAIQNLIFNAADATGKNGKVEIRLLIREDWFDIEVHDNGPGVPENIRDRVFDPFYSEKAQGNGLGLLAVKACAKAFSGDVFVADSDLGGACFRLTLPKPR